MIEMPVSRYVYSSLAFFGSERGGELPGRWFVTALAEVGCGEEAVRQTLWRMERSGELSARREGREKIYAPTGWAAGEIAAGTEKIFAELESWDGAWTLLHARFEGDERIHRDRLQEFLRVEGFATVAPGLHVHPRPRGERVLEAVDPAVRERVLVLRGDRVGEETDRAFAARHWDLPGLARRYRETRRALDRLDDGAVPDVEAFRRRFEVALRFLDVAWDDPGLPPDLLPEPWPGAEVRELAATLYERYRPGAMRYGDRILEAVGHAALAGVAG